MAADRERSADAESGSERDADLCEAAVADAAAIASRIPSPATLDRQLRNQRLFVVQLCAAPLIVAGAIWTLLIVTGVLGAPQGGFDPAHAGAPMAMVLFGWASYRFARAARVRAAAYTLVGGLLTIASASMIRIANVEATSIVAFCVAMSVAAIAFERRELKRVGIVLVVLAVASALLHLFPVVEQIELPPNLELIATMASTVLGLPYPMILFWLISSNLAASREEAWRAARAATDAAQVIDRRTEELQRVATRLESKNAELADFLYVVSHDLRAPLINLDGFSRALEEGVEELSKLDASTSPDAAEQRVEVEREIKESLGFITRSVTKMDFLVRAVLEISRLETRAEHKQSVDTAQLVDDILGSLQFAIAEREIHVTTEALPEIAGDPVRVHQVFTNLIDNAVKYMRPSGPARIRIACREAEGDYHFVVADNGVGIRAEDQARVFRLFTRVGGRDTEGEGIGLTSVRKIVEQAGGRIWVRSAPDKGSEFHFTWPMPAVTPTEERQDAAA